MANFSNFAFFGPKITKGCGSQSNRFFPDAEKAGGKNKLFLPGSVSSSHAIREGRPEHRTRNGTGTERERNGTRTREMPVQHLRNLRLPSALLAAGKKQMAIHNGYLLHLVIPSAFRAARKMQTERTEIRAPGTERNGQPCAMVFHTWLVVQCAHLENDGVEVNGKDDID